MNIAKRLYAYPVLSEERDDYNSSVFNVNFQYKMNTVNSLLMQFDITMDNPELKKLISSGQADYVVHLECSNTLYRTTIHSRSENISYEIPINRVNGQIEIIVLIVAKQDISSLTNSDWNEDYDGYSFDLPKGSIIGYKNIEPLDVIKNYEELNNASSIFIFYKKLTDNPSPMEINLETEKIGIGLCTQDFDIFSKLYNNIQFQPIINTMIILPALIYVFEELKQDNGIENYKTRNWYVSLNIKYKKRGINLEDEISSEDKTSFQLAQEAMSLPLNTALNMVSDIFGEENAEEF